MKSLAVSLLAVSLLGACAGGPPTRGDGMPVTAADAGPPPPDREQAIRDYLRATLKDPASAMVEDVAGPSFLYQKASIIGGSAYGWGLCFQVNAKNSYGGYVGYRTMVIIWRNGVVQRAFGGQAGSAIDQGMAEAACNHIKANL